MNRWIWVAAVSLSVSALASEPGKTTNVWTCSGPLIDDSLNVSRQSGKWSGTVTWDCWAKGGACAVSSDVEQVEQKSNAGSTIFTGPHFTLVIDTDGKPGKGGHYEGHITATAQGTADEGGGAKINENVSCRAKG